MDSSAKGAPSLKRIIKDRNVNDGLITRLQTAASPLYSEDDGYLTESRRSVSAEVAQLLLGSIGSASIQSRPDGLTWWQSELETNLREV